MWGVPYGSVGSYMRDGVFFFFGGVGARACVCEMECVFLRCFCAVCSGMFVCRFSPPTLDL